ELPESEPAAQPSTAAEPNRPQPRDASPNRTSWTPPSLWPRATESPPTAPEVQDVAQNSLQDNAQETAQETPQANSKESKGNKADSDARRLKVEPSVLHPQAAPRMPQGLGGPNVGLPIGPQLPRTPQSAPPGVAGIAAAWPPNAQKPEFEGDLAIK